MDDKKYDSRYDGETTDKILDNAKAIMEQTTAEDGETVQVYDTNGVPHKVSKTELLKKSTLALPALEDISSFVAVNAAGNAVGVMTKEQVASVLAELLEAPWFKELLRLALESNYYGHSLIELGDVVEVDGRMAYNRVSLIPRTHVIPEYGVIITHENDTWQVGYDYRNSEMKDWCIEAGGTHNLGLYLKCAQQTIPKKNMCSFWDMFGEIFGMPLRVATTTSRDPKEYDRIERMLRDMGAAAYGLFPEGTTVDLKESTRADAFNVYDKRIDRCNSEISKGILTVTMTMEDGASLSQSEVHRKMLENLIQKDADLIRDLVNWQLIPRMIRHGFPLKGFRFAWDESVDYTPEQQVAYERLLLEHYEVEPKYFVDKYNIPLKRKKDTSSIAVPDVKKTAQQKSGKEEQKLALPEGEHPFFD